MPTKCNLKNDFFTILVECLWRSEIIYQFMLNKLHVDLNKITNNYIEEHF